MEHFRLYDLRPSHVISSEFLALLLRRRSFLNFVCALAEYHPKLTTKASCSIEPRWSSVKFICTINSPGASTPEPGGRIVTGMVCMRCLEIYLRSATLCTWSWCGSGRPAVVPVQYLSPHARSKGLTCRFPVLREVDFFSAGEK